MKDDKFKKLELVHIHRIVIVGQLPSDKSMTVAGVIATEKRLAYIKLYVSVVIVFLGAVLLFLGFNENISNISVTIAGIKIVIENAAAGFILIILGLLGFKLASISVEYRKS